MQVARKAVSGVVVEVPLVSLDPTGLANQWADCGGGGLTRSQPTAQTGNTCAWSESNLVEAAVARPDLNVGPFRRSRGKHWLSGWVEVVIRYIADSSSQTRSHGHRWSSLAVRAQLQREAAADNTNGGDGTHDAQSWGRCLRCSRSLARVNHKTRKITVHVCTYCETEHHLNYYREQQPILRQ